VAESFFAAIKTELIHRQAWPTRATARQAIFEYIEGWYNTRRRHSSLGYRSPAAYENGATNIRQLLAHKVA
jgi:transposase InsO family protein